jgi:DNA-binding NtrC family response regulator
VTTTLEVEIAAAAPLPGMVGDHALMRDVYALVRAVAPTDLPVMIVGETGTGKELVARAVHALSPQASGPFVPVNAAAVAPTLFESEFFGHERGAFSDARAAKPGLLELAHGGTFFCDELGALSDAGQAKLLRAIEEGEVWRVGAQAPRPAAARWVAAFQSVGGDLGLNSPVRPELWHRLAGAVINMPPLRNRRSDIPMLTASFVSEAFRRYGHGPEQIEAAAIDVLLSYGWPGNVRELRMVVRRGVSLETGASLARSTVEAALGPASDRAGVREPGHSAPALRRLLEAYGGDTEAAARAAGIGRSTLYLWLKQAGLRPPRRPHSSAAWNSVGIELESGIERLRMSHDDTHLRPGGVWPD